MTTPNAAAALDKDIDVMRDAYMNREQRAAYERILARALAQEQAVSAPRGWIIRREGDEISVCAPNGTPGMMYVKNKGSLSNRLLYALADSLFTHPAPVAHRPAGVDEWPKGWRAEKINSHIVLTSPEGNAVAVSQECTRIIDRVLHDFLTAALEPAATSSEKS